MKSILLIGLGRFGRYIAMELSALNHQVMAIDINEERVNAVLPYVTNAQIGDSTKEEFMSTVGVDNFDTCIVAIGDNFQSSLETTCLLQELGARKIIARAARETQEKLLLRNGADEVVYPEKQLAAWTAIHCTSEHILEYFNVDKEYVIMELDVPDGWIGKSILELDIRRKYGINILGIRTNDRLSMNIQAETRFQEDTSVLVLGHQKDIQKQFRI